MDELLKPVLEDVYGVGSVQLCSASLVNPTLSVEVVAIVFASVTSLSVRLFVDCYRLFLHLPRVRA